MLIAFKPSFVQLSKTSSIQLQPGIYHITHKLTHAITKLKYTGKLHSDPGEVCTENWQFIEETMGKSESTHPKKKDTYSTKYYQ